MVQERQPQIPEGLINRQLARFEQHLGDPRVLVAHFISDINYNIRLPFYVVKHCNIDLSQRVLSILEALPGEYLSFALMEVDSDGNTIGHLITSSESRTGLVPSFLRCRAKLSDSAKEQLDRLTNRLGQTISLDSIPENPPIEEQPPRGIPATLAPLAPGRQKKALRVLSKQSIFPSASKGSNRIQLPPLTIVEEEIDEAVAESNQSPR